MRPSGSSARNTGRSPPIVRISATGWPGRAGVNLTGLLSTVIGTPHRPGQTRRPRVQRHDEGAGNAAADHWDCYCDGTSDALTAPAPGAGPAGSLPSAGD